MCATLKGFFSTVTDHLF